MSEFDKLVALDGVLMAGRLGPDGRVAEYKANRWYIENPAANQMAHWFCSTITMMLGSMAYAIDSVSHGGFDQSSWLPVEGWAFTGGDYTIVVRGDRFMFAERAKLGSLDELDRLLGKGQPSRLLVNFRDAPVPEHPPIEAMCPRPAGGHAGHCWAGPDGIARASRTADSRRSRTMAKQESVFIYIGTYPDETSAQDDYQVIKDLHSAGAVGTYDAAVVTKDYDGKVHENKDEMPTRHGAWGGAAVGAAIGILFPPALIATAAVGAAVGGVGAHLWRGMSRADVKELGDIIDEGQAALLVVGESKVEEAVEKAVQRAEKHVAKQLDVSPKDIDAAVQQAAGEMS